MASVVAEAVPMTVFEAAIRHIADLALAVASSGSLQRWSLALGEAALRFERDEVVEGGPLETCMYLSVDETGIPMRKKEVEGVRGRFARPLHLGLSRRSAA